MTSFTTETRKSLCTQSDTRLQAPLKQEIYYELLNRVPELVNKDRIVATVQHHAGKLSMESLKATHVLQESGRAIEKNVVDGFH